jgi:RNA polymerase sigma-70 factor (ECF subfamily)
MDKSKFEFILRTENKKIFNYLLKILRNREDAEDILQEVFIAFYKKMGYVNENTYTSYLYKTAHNKALNKIKSNKKTKNLMVPYDNIDNMKEIEPEKPDDLKNKIIRNAFTKLKSKEAYILELQFYQKMKYKEIAEYLSTTVSAIDSQLVRAKKKLKKYIMQEMKENKVYKNRGIQNE